MYICVLSKYFPKISLKCYSTIPSNTKPPLFSIAPEQIQQTINFFILLFANSFFVNTACFTTICIVHNNHFLYFPSDQQLYDILLSRFTLFTKFFQYSFVLKLLLQHVVSTDHQFKELSSATISMQQSCEQ